MVFVSTLVFGRYAFWATQYVLLDKGTLVAQKFTSEHDWEIRLKLNSTTRN